MHMDCHLFWYSVLTILTYILQGYFIHMGESYDCTFVSGSNFEHCEQIRWIHCKWLLIHDKT